MNKDKHNDIKIILLCLLLGIALEMFTISVLRLVLTMLPDVASQYSSNISGLLENSLSMILYVVLISPILEELVFRLAIMGVAKKFLGFLAANLIQAALFGIYHGNVVQGIYAFILGMVIGYIKELTGSVIYCVVLHGAFNAAGLMMKDYAGLIPISAMAGIALVSALAIAYIIINLRSLQCAQRSS